MHIKPIVIALGALLLATGCAKDHSKEIEALRVADRAQEASCASLSTDQKALADKLASLQVEHDALAQRLQEAEAASVAHTTELQSLSANNQARTESITALEARLAQTDASTGQAISSGIESQQKSLVALKDEIKAEMAAYAAREKERDGTIQKVLAALAQTREELKTANAQLESTKRSLAAAKASTPAPDSGPSDKVVADALNQRFRANQSIVQGIVLYNINKIEQINVLTRGEVTNSPMMGKVWPYKVQVVGVGTNNNTDFGRVQKFNITITAYFSKDSFGGFNATFTDG